MIALFWRRPAKTKGSGRFERPESRVGREWQFLNVYNPGDIFVSGLFYCLTIIFCMCSIKITFYPACAGALVYFDKVFDIEEVSPCEGKSK